jgi:hypothetical protein
MKKHFLVTISNDPSLLFGVRFLCTFFTTIAEQQITLLHICRQDDGDMARAMGQMWQGPADGIQGQLTVQARKAIDKAKELLKQHRMSIDQIMTKTAAERYGKVKDILMEGAKGCYDAIVLGRRATYALQWMFERPGDETAHAIIRDSGCATPLWICPEAPADRKNVLLCLDGSENSYRAADHVGYMLAGQKHHRITLFHGATGIGVKAAEIFSRAEAILHEHAIGDERIGHETSRGLTVAGAIQSECDRGGYAAIAVGLHGENREQPNKLKLAGATTTKLISKVEKAALWCCP